MKPLLYYIHLFLLLSLSLQAQSIGGYSERSHIFNTSGCQVTVESAFQNLSSWGHFPVTVTLRNDSSIDQKFSLKSVSSSSAPNHRGRKKEITKTSDYSLSCPAGSQKTFDLLLPLAMASYGKDDYWYNSGRSDSAKNNELLMEFKSGSESYNFSVEGIHFSNFFCSAISPGISTILLSQRTKNSWENVMNLSLLPVPQQGMAGYDQICILASEWLSLEKPAKDCLQLWVRQGGHLVIISPTKLTGNSLATSLEKNFKGLLMETKTKSQSGKFDSGMVLVHNEQYLADTLNNIPLRDANKITLTTLKTDFSSSAGMSSPWPLHDKLPQQDGDIFVTSLLLIVFVLIVGPLNFFVFAKQGRRHRLFYTTPFISLGMSAVLILYILLKDGTGGRGYQIILKEIDQEANTSYTIQEQFCRTGVLFGSSFELDKNLTIDQVPIPTSRWARVNNSRRQSQENYTIKNTDSTRIFSGNYFSSRSEQGHLITGNQVTQESVNISPKGDSIEVISTFKDPLDILYVRLKGELFVAKNLTTGTPVIAEKSDRSAWLLWREQQREKFSKSNARILKAQSNRENSYIGFSSRASGINTNKSISWETEAVITGRLNPVTYQ